MKDLYQVLGLDSKVYQSLIKRKYRELAKKHHPDKWGGDDYCFREIKHAYEILSNVEKRKIYDQVNGYENYSDIINDYLRIDINLYPENILLNIPVSVRYRRSNVCLCEGRDIGCKYCEGFGIMYEDIDMIFRETDMYYRDLEFIVDNAGNVNKYGEKQEVKGRIKYILPDDNWEYIESIPKDVLGTFVYNVKLSDNFFKQQILNQGNIHVYIDKIGDYNLNKGSFSNGNVVNTEHPRLKIRLNVFVENLNQLF